VKVFLFNSIFQRCFFFLVYVLVGFNGEAKPVVSVGSKTFTESYVLAEIISQIIEDAGEATVDRKFGLGATGISYEAMKSGDVDIYAEYTGTIAQTILKRPDILEHSDLKNVLESEHSILLSDSIGFNNAYVFAMTKAKREELKLDKISDLAYHTDLKTVFTLEFMRRADGLRSLESHYGFRFSHPVGMEHSLAFEAVNRGEADLMEVYSTDAKIKRYDLHLLKDDKSFFPEYLSVLMSALDFPQRFPKSWSAIQTRLIGKISNEKMIELNSLVENDGESFAQVAAIFLGKKRVHDNGVALNRILNLTKEHLKLVFVSLFFSILIGVPLGVIATKAQWLGHISLFGSGLLQTIPSLALLCFLIPVFGIGATPAYVALFLYGLLPIVRSTYTGISQISKELEESSDLIGLTGFEKLRLIHLPLASVNIMAGIKMSVIINIGTATLAAFIGAGGLGSLIVTGLALNNNSIILAGAIPAALLAAATHLLFMGVDWFVIPRGLK
jgi:osmoprotectant transport system permease protein